MTSRSLDTNEAHAIDDALLADIYADTMEAPSDCESTAFSQQGDRLYIDRAEGVKGATAALTAISLEIAAAFGLYCIWHLWHMLR